MRMGTGGGKRSASSTPPESSAVDYLRRQARIHRADGNVSLLTAQDSLDGEDVLPGFSLPLAELL